MFGGEDKNRKLLNNVHVLDLQTMSWSISETTQTIPAPRFDHTAAVHAGRYLLIFGGCSYSVFFGDLHVLDLEMLEWSKPEVQGDVVAPRAGHAGVTVDDKWYIVGGGDNKSGAPETLVLNMSKLVLSVLTSVKGRDPLASEGLSVSSSIIHGEKFLVAFGGYNGKYNNEVLHSVQGQLVAERSSCAKLEAQIAELQKMLVQSIEVEVQEIRRQKAECDRDIEVASTVQRQSSGGVWRWVSG